MKIELQPLTAINPYDKNPRDNDSAVDAVAESIRRFGFATSAQGAPKSE